MTQPLPSAPAPSWQATLLPIEASIQEAIACLDKSSMKIVVVVDSSGILVGTVTDGDIRYVLLEGEGRAVIRAAPRATVEQVIQRNSTGGAGSA